MTKRDEVLAAIGAWVFLAAPTLWLLMMTGHGDYWGMALLVITFGIVCAHFTPEDAA